MVSVCTCDKANGKPSFLCPAIRASALRHVSQQPTSIRFWCRYSVLEWQSCAEERPFSCLEEQERLDPLKGNQHQSLLVRAPHFGSHNSKKLQLWSGSVLQKSKEYELASPTRIDCILYDGAMLLIFGLYHRLLILETSDYLW